jgi:hypothetical protein
MTAGNRPAFYKSKIMKKYDLKKQKKLLNPDTKKRVKPDFKQLKRVQVDDKTWIYVAMNRDSEKAKAEYLAKTQRHHNFFKPHFQM